jgi:hypothetical protein
MGMDGFVLGIDQSTSGTKAILFDAGGGICARQDIGHRQIVDAGGWVERDPGEIFANLIKAVAGLVGRPGSTSGKYWRPASATSGKPASPGTGKPASRSITPLSGNAPAARKYAGA